MKKLISLFLALVCALSISAPITVSAATRDVCNDCIEGDYEFITNSSNVTEAGYINNWDGFLYYYTSTFTEFRYNNNCGPTQVANLLSYYKSIGYIYAFSENTITQSYYTNTICPAVGYTTSGNGISLNAAANGFETLFEAGASYYEVTIKNELSLSWANFKSRINNNKPILLAHDGHLYFVVGYQKRNGTNYYVAITAFTNPAKYALIEYSTVDSNRKSITIE